MTGAVLDRSVQTEARSTLGGGTTLEELLGSVLHELQANGSTECPMCRGRMTSTRAGGECGACGSRLG